MFLLILVFVVLMVSFNLYLSGQDYLTSLRVSIFNVVSIITGTGFGMMILAMGGFATTLLLILMFMGGYAGSTTSGSEWQGYKY